MGTIDLIVVNIYCTDVHLVHVFITVLFSHIIQFSLEIDENWRVGGWPNPPSCSVTGLFNSAPLLTRPRDSEAFRLRGVYVTIAIFWDPSEGSISVAFGRESGKCRWGNSGWTSKTCWLASSTVRIAEVILRQQQFLIASQVRRTQIFPPVSSTNFFKPCLDKQKPTLQTAMGCRICIEGKTETKWLRIADSQMQRKVFSAWWRTLAKNLWNETIRMVAWR